ncbi:unnamed protein product [Schistosoma bovis]|nr:unnamed protein product [Schistosoma bovis]
MKLIDSELHSVYILFELTLMRIIDNRVLCVSQPLSLANIYSQEIAMKSCRHHNVQFSYLNRQNTRYDSTTCEKCTQFRIPAIFTPYIQLSYRETTD